MNSTVRLNIKEREVLDLYDEKILERTKKLEFEKLEEDLYLEIIKNFEEKEKNSAVELISLENIKKELKI